MRDFPKMLYRAGAGTMVDGVECAALVVHSEAEQTAALADGWGFSLDAPLIVTKTYADGTTATGPGPLPDESPADDAPPTRAELETKAMELGVAFDGRWGDKRLAAAIAAKLAG